MGMSRSLSASSPTKVNPKMTSPTQVNINLAVIEEELQVEVEEGCDNELESNRLTL